MLGEFALGGASTYRSMASGPKRRPAAQVRRIASVTGSPASRRARNPLTTTDLVASGSYGVTASRPKVIVIAQPPRGITRDTDSQGSGSTASAGPPPNAVRAYSADPARSAPVSGDVLGMEPEGRARWLVRGEHRHDLVVSDPAPAEQGMMGAGAVHRVAERQPAPIRVPVGPDAEEVLKLVHEQTDEQLDQLRMRLAGLEPGTAEGSRE